MKTKIRRCISSESCVVIMLAVCVCFFKRRKSNFSVKQNINGSVNLKLITSDSFLFWCYADPLLKVQRYYFNKVNCSEHKNNYIKERHRFCK